MTDLEDKVALVTGATSGIGEAVARRLVRRGCRVIAAGRRRERLEALSREVGDELLPLPLDVRDSSAVAAGIGGLGADFAAIEILVNNAGLGRGNAPVEAAVLADWDEMVDTNIKGLMYVLHAVLPGMVERRRGHIVNMGSIAASYAYPGSNIYGSTKAFVRRLSLNLRTDLAGTGIRVTNVEPGAVETEFSLVRLRGDAEAARAIYAGYTPLASDDIAEIVDFVLSVPPHVNINTIEVMPTEQCAAGLRYGSTET